MSLGLGNPVPVPSLDAFMHREGYEIRARLYHPVTRCWCGSAELGPARGFVGVHDALEAYQYCHACRSLVLRYVLPEEGLAELYGIRYFREHQTAIGFPPFPVRYENDATDRIPVWLDVLRRHVPSGRVLEVGCSHGRFVKELSLAGYDVLGLELDTEIAAWAKQKTGLDIRPQRIETLPPSGFNAVFANDVIEHVYDPRAFLSDATRVLDVGGRGFFQTVVFDRPEDCPPGMLRPLYHTILYCREAVPLLAPANAKVLPVIPSVFNCYIVAIERTR